MVASWLEWGGLKEEGKDEFVFALRPSDLIKKAFNWHRRKEKNALENRWNQFLQR